MSFSSALLGYARPRVLWERLRTPVRVAVIAGAGTVLIGVRSVPTVVVVILATLVIAAIARQFLVQLRPFRRERSLPGAVGRLLGGDSGYWGGQIAHVGVALAAVAIAASSALAVRGQVQLAPGETATFDGYCLAYDGPFRTEEPNRVVEGAEMRLLREDCTTEIRSITPHLSRFPNSAQPVATPEVRTGLVEDVYVTLAGGDADGLTVEVSVFPMMWLLWGGGMVTVSGGFWAFLGRRRRRVDTTVAVAGSVGDG